MAEIKINGKDYDLETLSDKAKQQIVSLQFVQNELQKLNAQIAAYKTAEVAYSKALENEIN